MIIGPYRALRLKDIPTKQPPGFRQMRYLITGGGGLKAAGQSAKVLAD
jgi:hypothetical protein